VLCAPPRDYRLLAELLIRSAAGGERMAVKAALERAAAELGESLAAAGERLEQILRDHGYEPFLSEHGVLRLRNCPFDSVAGQCPAVVCDLNLALIRGILTGLGADPGRASLKPQRGNCCVAIRSYEDGKEVPVNPDFMSGTWLGHPPDPPLTMS
jgi:predicted ArsR family transcriptional regulator